MKAPTAPPAGEWPDATPLAFVRNDDGTYSPATPLGFAPGIDWEIYAHAPAFRHVAIAYRGHDVLVTVRARRRWVLWARIALATATRCGWSRTGWLRREPVRFLR